MCGIAGYIGNKKFLPNKNKISSCVKEMVRRGPDNQSYLQFENKLNYLFCASRLSIIDIDKRSNQPFEDDEGILVFNGEIYNYLEIKKKIKTKGLVFKTNSDTEVLLKYLNLYGGKNLSELEGMWSFVYYSKIKNITIISRDKFGEKPLFFNYSKKNKTFFFGSNVNYIRKLSYEKFQINENKILNFLRYGYRSVFSTKDTFFKKINYLPSATNIIIDENFNIKFKKYWNKKKYHPEKNNLNKSILILKKLIKKNFSNSLRSDVPIAFLLSGGIDSSIIASISSKIKKKFKFYSFKSTSSKYVETKNINLIKKKFKLKHEYIVPNKKENLNILTKYIQDFGFPLMSSTYLAYGQLCKKINKDRFKVLVSGNGGDEIFSGYYAHHMSFLSSIYKTKEFEKNYIDWQKKTRPFIRSKILKNFQLFNKLSKENNPTFHETKDYLKYFKKKYKYQDLKSKKYYKDKFINHLDKDLFEDSIPPQMHSIDNISMHYSIESRAPFLSKNLYEFRNSLKKNFLVKNGLAKFILRKAFSNVIPDEIINDPEKIGFYSTLNENLNLKNLKITNLILNNAITKKYLNRKLIKYKIDTKQLNHQDEKFIFSLLNIALFLKKNN